MACNSLPGLRCGFVQTPQDVYLFGRINNGNVVSLPLGLNFGWSGELNLRYTLENYLMENLIQAIQFKMLNVKEGSN